MKLLGIDPGLSGAFAVLDAATGNIVAVCDLPVLNISRGKAARRDLDGHSLLRLIEDQHPDHAFIEQAQAMPGQSAYATGIFFQVYGEIRGLLIGAGVPLTIVSPNKWKRSLGVPAGKDGARARASQLLPDGARQWPLKKHHGRAEAALIALYGWRTIGTAPMAGAEAAGGTAKRPEVVRAGAGDRRAYGAPMGSAP
jgi:crossover junction endodeoxyribonuclease RuvC